MIISFPKYSELDTGDNGPGKDNNDTKDNNNNNAFNNNTNDPLSI